MEGVPEFHVDIVTPERSLYSGPAVYLRAPGKSGDIGVLARHAPLIGRLRPGHLLLRGRGEFVLRLLVSGGLIEVQGHGAWVLLDTAMREEGLDMEKARQACERARVILREQRVAEERGELEAELLATLELARALERARNPRQR